MQDGAEMPGDPDDPPVASFLVPLPRALVSRSLWFSVYQPGMLARVLAG
jgi:hypothetical protein